MEKQGGVVKMTVSPTARQRPQQVRDVDRVTVSAVEAWARRTLIYHPELHGSGGGVRSETPIRDISCCGHPRMMSHICVLDHVGATGAEIRRWFEDDHPLMRRCGHCLFLTSHCICT